MREAPGMFKRLGRLTTTHPWIICSGWMLAAVVLSAVAPAWDSATQDDDIRFLPERTPSVRGYSLLEKSFPQEVFASRLIFAVQRDVAPLTPADFRLVDRLVDDLKTLRQEDTTLQIGAITCYRDGLVGRRLVSEDSHCTLIQVALGTPQLALQTRTTVDRAEARLRERLAGAGPDVPCLMVTGPAGLGRDLTSGGASSLERTTLATVALVIVVLLLVYRAPLLALVPLVTIAVSVVVSLRILALATLIPGVHLVSISRIFAVVILYGAGTDYCLFLISRYREELLYNADRSIAIARSVCAVGGALAASAGTVICGLGMMGFAEFAKVRCAGPAIAVSLAVALLASLTLAPALLQVFGRFVFWPSAVPAPKLSIRRFPGADFTVTTRQSVWDRISRAVVARPGLVWATSVLVLAPLVLIGMRVSPNYRSTGELPPSAESVRGIAAIERHFTAGEVGPLTVLLVSARDWGTPAGRSIISHLSRGFSLLPNVAEVRSLTQPLGVPLALPPPVQFSSKGIFDGVFKAVRRGIDDVVENANRSAREYYLAPVTGASGPEFVTRLDVVFRSDPFDRASLESTELIQTWLEDQLPRTARHWSDVHGECYGVSVNAHDLAATTEADRVRVNFLVVAGIFLILLMVVRRPWLAAYLLLTVLLSYYATLGATVLFGALWWGKSLGTVEWRVPFFLFTILVAVGEDYNILLITRVLQEQSRRGIKAGTREALARTGATITSCGLIMAGTFGTLMLTNLGTLVQIGFALAFGVLLDTFIVRPFLVPAFVLLVWRQKPSTAAPPVTTRPLRLAG
jgi:putative drug exporter of the RND superfamily